MDFKKLLKAELHRHIDGAIRLGTIVDIINQQNIIVDKYWSLQDIKNGKITDQYLSPYIYATNKANLNDYLQAFEITGACLKTKQNLRRAIFEIVEDAKNENIIHLELRYAPCFHLNDTDLDSISKVNDFVIQQIVEAKLQYDISLSLIVCQMKLFDENHIFTQQVTKLFNDTKREIDVAYDQAGPEDMVQFIQYENTFKQLHKTQAFITLHAGEASGAESVWNAIKVGGAIRIGHGVRIQEDEKVVQLVKENKIVLEMCPSSNVQTKVNGINQNLSNYPLQKYLHNGIRCVICTDNPLMSQCDINFEYQQLFDKLSLTPAEILLITMFSINASFISDQLLKQQLVEKVFRNNVQYLKQFDNEVEQNYCILSQKF